MSVFAEKTAIVTGGASGIGRALVEELARRGACVVLADVNAKRAEETADSITGAGHRAKAVTLDVTDMESVRKLVEDTVVEYGKLDYIFNNAGIAVLGEARDCSYDDWRRVIDTNLYGVVNGVVAAYPVMLKQGFGHIVNTASLAGLVPAPNEASYVASKFGVVGLSSALRAEGADLGVRVSVICPGFIETPILYESKVLNMDHDKMLGMLPKTMPAEKCARVILRGVERNKAIIPVTGMAWAFWALQRISPRLVLRILRRLMRNSRAIRIEE